MNSQQSPYEGGVLPIELYHHIEILCQVLESYGNPTSWQFLQWSTYVSSLEFHCSHSEYFYMVDRRRIELLLHACKAHVLPLSLTAQITDNLSFYTPSVKASFCGLGRKNRTPASSIQGSETTTILYPVKLAPYLGIEPS